MATTAALRTTARTASRAPSLIGGTAPAAARRLPCPSSPWRPLLLSSSPAVSIRPSPQRSYAQTPASSSRATTQAGQRSPRVQTTFIILCSVAILATAYGVYEYYLSFSTWPRELRDDLRTALQARNRGDVKQAKISFEKVLAAARRMAALPTQATTSGEENAGTGALGVNPTLKTTGIAIAYAAMLEQEGSLDAAYKVYSEALDEILLRGNFDPELGRGPGSISKRVRYEEVRSPEERMRAVAIAQRMGDLALRPTIRDDLVNSGRWQTGPAEEHLRWSVEELLRLVAPDVQARRSKTGEEDGILLTELQLPAWVTKTDIGASLEALGGFYASRNNIEYAVPLFLQALALLLPPTASSTQAEPTLASKLAGSEARREPTPSERCHAGVLMNNLAQLLVQVPESSPLRQAPYSLPGSSSTAVAPFDQGLAWAHKGLDIVQSTQASCGWVNSARDGVGVNLTTTGDVQQDLTRAECARAQVTLLYNLGQIYEMSKDLPTARRYYQRAYAEADRYAFRDARSRSAQGLSRLERRSAASSK